MPGGKGGVMRGIFGWAGQLGKAVVLQWLLQGPWRNLADKLAIWSPTIVLQPDWEPILELMKTDYGQRRDKLWAFENINHGDMSKIVHEWTEQTRQTLAKRSE